VQDHQLRVGLSDCLLAGIIARCADLGLRRADLL